MESDSKETDHISVHTIPHFRQYLMFDQKEPPAIDVHRTFMLERDEECKKNQHLHEMSGHYYQRLHMLLSYPNVILAGIMVPVSALLQYVEDDMLITILNTIAFSVISFLSISAGYFGYDELSHKHFAVSGLYYCIHIDITAELAMCTAESPLDVRHIERVRQKMEHLNTSSPNIPLVFM